MDSDTDLDSDTDTTRTPTSDGTLLPVIDSEYSVISGSTSSGTVLTAPRRIDIVPLAAYRGQHWHGGLVFPIDIYRPPLDQVVPQHRPMQGRLGAIFSKHRIAYRGFDEHLRVERVHHYPPSRVGELFLHNVRMNQMSVPQMYWVWKGDWILAVNGIRTVDGMVAEMSCRNADLLIVIFRRPYPANDSQETWL